MNLSRKSFLGSIGGFFAGIPFLTGKKKIKETFSVMIEEIGEQRFRATLKTSGFFSQKIAVIDGPEFDEDHPVQAYAKLARLHLLFEIQRAMKLHVFPEDSQAWNNPVSYCFGVGVIDQSRLLPTEPPQGFEQFRNDMAKHMEHYFDNLNQNS